MYKEIKPFTSFNKSVLVLGSFDDSVADEIEFKELYLVEMKFGDCKYKDKDKRIQYFEIGLVEFIARSIELNRKFDLIIMTGVIEHLVHQDKTYCLGKIGRLLTENGIFILGYPNCSSTNRLLGVEMNHLPYACALSSGDREIGHYYMYDWRATSHFGMYLGMKEIRKIGIMFKPLPNSLMDKYFKKELDVFIEIGKELGIKACGYILVIYQGFYNNDNRKE